ncbi:MAG: RDD family protein [Deltaproteobacteria bacterium]|nr:RDD family protein [Deltaproteobacteria bacterium]
METVSSYSRASGARRAIAAMIDLALISALTVVFNLKVYPADRMEFPPRVWNYFDYMVDLINHHPELLLPTVATFFAFFTVYFILLEWLLSSSAGKFIARIIVISSSGTKPGFFRTAARTLLKAATTVLFFIGPLSIILSRSGRTIYDILSGCCVVNAGSKPL